MENKVLVAYATAAGATGEIAEAVGEVLREAGSVVDVVPVKEVSDLGPYGGVVVGSGVRANKVYAEATTFMSAHEAALSEKPVACFVACATLSEDTEEARQRAAGYAEALAAAAPKVQPVAKQAFGGAIVFAKLPFIMRLLLKVMGKQEGDWRDWDGIRAWAAELGPKLAA